MLIGALATGEDPTDSEANDSLATLNEIVDKWNVENLMIFSTINIEVPLTGKKHYTIGPGGDIDTYRPPNGVSMAYYLNPQGISMPVQVVTEGQYNSIVLKDLNSTIPSQVYYSSSYPLADLYTYPISNEGEIILTVSDQFKAFDSLDTIIDLPSGYIKALRYNLAVELSTEYGRQLDDRIESMAVGAKAFIKTTNGSQKKEILVTDMALRGRGGKYNIYTGA